MERASVERQAASAAAATIKAMGGHLNKRGESSGSVTEAEEESNHSSFDTATTASLATTPGSGNATAALGGSLRPSTGAGEQDGGGRRREPHGSGATVTSSLSSGSAVASAGPLASPPLTSEPAAAGGATEAGAEAGAAAAGGAGEVAQQPPGTQQGPPSEGGAGGGGGEAGGGGRAALPVLQPPDEGTPAAEALAANAAIPHRGRGTLSRAGSMSMGRKNKSLRRLARNLQKKKKKKKQRRNFQGNVIKGEHEQYTLTIGMMLGIRVAVGRPQQMDDLTLMDFMQVDKYLFPPKGCNKPPHRTPPHHLSHDFKFKDYAPKIFHRIRQLFGIDSASYMLSVSGNYNYLEFMSNSKSGQFFFYSHDGRFMIKTQTPEENKFLRKILPHYYQYVSLNPDTLLTRFYGMHRVKMRHLKRKVHFVIMHSVFDTKEKIYRIYDIKGSTVGRSSGPDRLRKEGVVYKDLDLVDDKVKFQLGTKRRLFMEQLEKDASFLASLNIMDYSLLIGIHDKTRRERDREDSLERPGSASAAGGDGASSSGAGADNGGGGGGGPESLRRYHSHHSHHHGQLLGASPTGAPLLPPAPSGLGRPRGDSQASAGEAGAEGSHGGLHHQQAHHHHFHHHHSYREARDRDGHGGGPPTRSMREFSYESSSAGVGEEGGTTVGGSAEYDEENYQSYDDSDFDSEMSDSDDDIPPPPMMPTGFSHPSQGHSAVSHGSDHTPLGLPTEASILTSATNERRLTHRRDHGVQSRLADGSKGNEVYFVGIIDILQQYNSFKRAETFFKSFKYDSRQISAVEPAWYARRFVDFCAQHIS